MLGFFLSLGLLTFLGSFFFFLLALLSAARVHRPSLQGSVYWMAPEVVKQTAYTHKADIWSVGCLVVEMLTGTHPWASLNQMQAIFKVIHSSCYAISIYIFFSKHPSMHL